MRCKDTNKTQINSKILPKLFAVCKENAICSAEADE
jgi:hypothetical protein